MSIVIADGDKSLEPRPLTGASLLLDGHDLQNLVFQTEKRSAGKRERREEGAKPQDRVRIGSRTKKSGSAKKEDMGRMGREKELAYRTRFVSA